MKNSKISWVNNLEVNINNKKIESLLTHSQLQSTNTIFSIKLKDVLPPSGTDKSSGEPKANSLTVNIGFVLSKLTKHGSHYVSIPIKIPGYGFFSVADSYVDKEYKNYSAKSLEARHILGLDTNVHTNKVQLNGPLHYHTNVDGPTYDSKFHHTEQAFYEYIIQRSNIENLVKRLKEYGIQQNTVIEAVIIDMHSIRYVCGNCEIGALGLINENYSFTSQLSSVLHDYKLIVPESLKIIPRISANKPDGTQNRVPTTEHANIDSTALSFPILEADTKVYKLSNTNTDLYNRSIFISSDISGNTNYSSTRYNLLQQEYLKMIKHGKNLANHTNLNPKKTEDGLIKVQDNLFHSLKNIKEIENAFYELSLIDKINNNDCTQLDYKVAKEIIEARQEIDNEISADNLELTKLKYKLLKTDCDHTQVINLSTDALININVLIEEYDVDIEQIAGIIENLNFIKILQNLPKSILELIANVLFLKETITIDEFVTMYDLYSNKFLNFMKDAYNSNLEINEDLQFYVELYMNKLDTDNISLILNYADLDQIKPLYNKSTQDFFDFISEVYEEEDLLEERGITDLFELYIQVPQEDRWLLWEYLRGNSNPDKASTQRMDSYLNAHVDISTNLSSYGSDDEYNIYLAGEINS
jgi:hypothetical protein